MDPEKTNTRAKIIAKHKLRFFLILLILQIFIKLVCCSSVIQPFT